MECRDSNGVPRYPCPPSAVFDLATTRYYPSPRPELEVPVVRFDPPSGVDQLMHSFPQQDVDALRDRKQITLITNGWRAHAQHSGWLTARLKNASVPLSVEEGSSGGVITDRRSTRSNCSH